MLSEIFNNWTNQTEQPGESWSFNSGVLYWGLLNFFIAHFIWRTADRFFYRLWIFLHVDNLRLAREQLTEQLAVSAGVPVEALEKIRDYTTNEGSFMDAVNLCSLACPLVYLCGSYSLHYGAYIALLVMLCVGVYPPLQRVWTLRLAVNLLHVKGELDPALFNKLMSSVLWNTRRRMRIRPG